MYQSWQDNFTMTQYFGSNLIRLNQIHISREKISTNPELKDLSESIRQYGVLQPIVVTRREFQKTDGGLGVEYELISGERRLRASKIAGLSQIPVVIRSNEESDLMKLELAIIENLQREDLNCVDRAKAFQKLAVEFNLKHTQIAQKIGRSREYVSNSLRILSLPEHMLVAISEGKILEGHTRPLLMLIDRPDEQETLFKEILYKKITVRDAELIARKIAVEKSRKKENIVDPEIVDLEKRFAESLGTRVHIEKGQNGGTIKIDFFSNADVKAILDLINTHGKKRVDELLDKHIAEVGSLESVPKISEEEAVEMDDDPNAKNEEGEDLYSVKNFSL